MGGLAVLLIVTLYLVAAVFVVRAVNGRRAKIIATIIVTLIPTADAILGRLYLEYLCETEGGTKVYRVVEYVEGFMWNGAIAMSDSDEGSKRFLDEFGVYFIESAPKPGGKVDRLSLQDGKVIRERGVSSRSTYAYRYTRSKHGPMSMYTKQQNRIESLVNKQVIATDTQFIFDGGWAEYFLASFSDAGPGGAAWCSAPDSWERLRKLVGASFKTR